MKKHLALVTLLIFCCAGTSFAAFDSATPYGKSIVGRLDNKSKALIEEKWSIEKRIDKNLKKRGLLIRKINASEKQGYQQELIGEYTAKGLSYEKAKAKSSAVLESLVKKWEKSLKMTQIRLKKDKEKLPIVNSKIKKRLPLIKRQYRQIASRKKHFYYKEKKSWKEVPSAYTCTTDPFFSEFDLSYECFQTSAAKRVVFNSIKSVELMIEYLQRKEGLTQEKIDYLILGIHDVNVSNGFNEKKSLLASKCSKHLFVSDISVNEHGRMIINACARLFKNSIGLNKVEKSTLCYALSDKYQSKISDYNILEICDKKQSSNSLFISFSNCIKQTEKMKWSLLKDYTKRAICRNLDMSFEDILKIKVDDCYKYLPHNKCTEAHQYKQTKVAIETLSDRRKSLADDLAILPPAKFALDFGGALVESTLHLLNEAGAKNE